MDHERIPWFKRLAAPRVDFVDLLVRQANYSRAAIQAMRTWSTTGGDSHLDEVVELEMKADELHKLLMGALFVSFETPLDREDINDLCRHLDNIVDSARHAVSKIRAMEIQSGARVEPMLANIDRGLGLMIQAIQELRKSPESAWTHADQARHTQRVTEDLEARGLASVLRNEDVREVFRQRELLHIVTALGHKVELTAEGMMHAVNKIM